MNLLPWPSYWLPHLWCENTVSHHGVNVTASFINYRVGLSCSGSSSSSSSESVRVIQRECQK
jgi:hypothetical protein